MLLNKLTTPEKEFLTFVICGENDQKEPFHKTVELYFWARKAGLHRLPPEQDEEIFGDFFADEDCIKEHRAKEWSDAQIFSGDPLDYDEYEILEKKICNLSDEETQELKKNLTILLDNTRPVYYPSFD